jgi:hypothetical protein
VRHLAKRKQTYLVRVLSLEIVDIAAINHVARIDEELCSPHGLEKITGSLHLCHEFDEKLSTGICVNTLHETVNGANKTARIRKSVVVNDRWIISVRIRCDGGQINCRSSRPKNRNRIVRRAMCHHAHADEHDHEIEENRSVGQDPKFLECADLTDTKANERPNETADGIAEFEFGDLGKGLAVADDDITDAEEQLKTLQEVDDIARDSAVNTEREIGIVLAGILVGIKAHEARPQKPAGTEYQCQYGCD